MSNAALFMQGDQTLFHLPMDRDARVVRVQTSTYHIVDLAKAEEVVPDTLGLLDPVETTLTMAAGPHQGNPRLLAVDDATGYLPGHHYLLREDGATLPFVADEVDTENNRILASRELGRAFTAGAEVLGVELQAVLPAAAAADSSALTGGPYAVIWEYELHGQPQVRDQIVHLARYSVLPFVTEDEVVGYWPPLAHRMGERASVRNALKAATTDFIAKIEAAGKQPAYFRGSTAAKVAVAKRAVAYCLRWTGPDRDRDVADELDTDFKRLTADLVNGAAPQGTVQIDPASNKAKRPLSQNSFFRRP